jgi:23S rRNA (uracil1939-C5)-methyltransferase
VFYFFIQDKHKPAGKITTTATSPAFDQHCTPLPSKEKMNTHSLTISKVINGGDGLGQLENGRLAMVPGTLPGEKVTITELEDKKSYILGKVLSIDQQSAARVVAPCRYYSQCGGCDLQHAAYPEQLRLKTGIVADLLFSSQNIDSDSDGQHREIRPTLASPQTLHYRQRIRLWVDRDGRCGFRQYHSHNIIPIQRCIIAKEPINEAFAHLVLLQPFNRLLSQTTELELLWNPDSDKVTAIFHQLRKPRPADFTTAQELCDRVPALERIYFTGEKFPLTQGAPAGTGNTMAVEYLPAHQDDSALHLSWEVGGFCQVNLEQNYHLIECVLNYAAVTSHDTVLDLFCGSGNFSIPLARQAESLLGIEGQGAAIRSARANSDASGLTNTTFEKGPIHQSCESLCSQGAVFDCIVVDPPRQGIPGLARQLYALCRSRMIYISCDPATLCRDLADLQKAGFILKIIQPVDMFPQTHHIETVVLLEKN